MPLVQTMCPVNVEGLGVANVAGRSVPAEVPAGQGSARLRLVFCIIEDSKNGSRRKSLNIGLQVPARHDGSVVSPLVFR
jgi:hypothetical protein